MYIKVKAWGISMIEIFSLVKEAEAKAATSELVLLSLCQLPVFQDELLLTYRQYQVQDKVFLCIRFDILHIAKVAALEEEKKALEAKSWIVGLTEWLGNTWIFNPK